VTARAADGWVMDLRPIAYLLGRMVVVMAALMLIPAVVDWRVGNLDNALDFLRAAMITGGLGILVAIAARNAVGLALDIRQAYLLTAGIWFVLPLTGALPLMMGAPGLSLTDAYFEAVSGLTTTGSTVITGLDAWPVGMNLWRGMLNWTGGLGIAFVAMIFLPILRVGGMQFFRTEGFDTFGKVLPRANDIASQLLAIYAGLTVACVMTYLALGQTALDATVHGMATIATGGFSPRDASFSMYAGANEYAGALFMILGSLPYIRYVQLVNGHTGPILRDAQVRGYLKILGSAVLIVTIWRVLTSDMGVEPAFREALFNLASIQSSTGFFSGSFSGWGDFMIVIAFVIGVIGACSGSSAAGIGVFRCLIAWDALRAHVRLITMPDRMERVKYEGRAVDDDVLNSVVMFITGYIVILGTFSVAVTLTGVDAESALFGVWTSIGNIGYGFGPEIAKTGTLQTYPDAAKWIFVLAMLLGRLGLLAILVVVLPRFWRV
jgi:trk system potassium uptake protein